MLRIFFVLIMLMCSSVVYAQSHKTAEEAQESFWEQHVDPSSEWGQWINTTVRPYLEELTNILKEQMQAADENVHALVSAQPNNLTPEKLLDVIRPAYGKILEAYQKMAPPAEFEQYHALVISMYAKLMQNKDYTQFKQEVFMDLAEKMDLELQRIFAEHGVPQDVIDAFRTAVTEE